MITDATAPCCHSCSNSRVDRTGLRPRVAGSDGFLDPVKKCPFAGAGYGYLGVGEFTILKKKQRRNAAYAVSGEGFRVVVDVHLGNPDPVAHLLGVICQQVVHSVLLGDADASQQPSFREG